MCFPTSRDGRPGLLGRALQSFGGTGACAAERPSLSTTTHESSVLQRIAAGDPAAVQDCLDRYGGLVWSLARRLCPTRADAEDAVQEVFVAVWRNADRFDPSLGSEPTFVAMIARRRLIDRVRRAGRRPGESALGEHHAGSEGLDDRPDLSEQAARAREALRGLSDDQQRVIQLAIFHGLSHEKISAATGMPLGTVKTHIRRGLIKVRQILGADPREAAAVPTGGAR
jgi:RNA polymerase sigma-70 factor (ECF subfamily)